MILMAKEEIVNKVKEVMNAPSCYSGLKKVVRHTWMPPEQRMKRKPLLC